MFHKENGTAQQGATAASSGRVFRTSLTLIPSELLRRCSIPLRFKLSKVERDFRGKITDFSETRLQTHLVSLFAYSDRLPTLRCKHSGKKIIHRLTQMYTD